MKLKLSDKTVKSRLSDVSIIEGINTKCLALGSEAMDAPSEEEREAAAKKEEELDRILEAIESGKDIEVSEETYEMLVEIMRSRFAA